MPLPKIYSRSVLAKLLGVSKGYLYSVSKKSDYFYRNFTLRKKTRGKRQIHAPIRALKGIQRWILNELLENIPVNSSAKGFVTGSSIVDNAKLHVNKLYVLNIDLKDFFPSVKSPQVYRVFFDRLGYRPVVASILTNLTTLNNSLPQGAPTSPYLSNLVCDEMDRRIEAYCGKNNLAYSRYADDLTVSGNQRLNFVFPVLSRIISEYGFKINSRKIRYSHRGNRMMVTGLTVNDKVSIPRGQRKIYRAIFHEAKLSPEKYKARYSQLAGYYAFLKMVSPGLPCLAEYKLTLEAIQSV